MWVDSYQVQSFEAGSEAERVRDETQRTPGGILEDEDG